MGIFLLLVFLVGFAFSRLIKPAHELPPEQYEDPFTAPAELPPQWQKDPSKRGTISALVSTGERLFAAGAGMGVYTRDGGGLWRPFNRGLGKSRDIRSLALGPAQEQLPVFDRRSIPPGRAAPPLSSTTLYCGSEAGRLHAWIDGKWRLIARTESALPITWIRPAGTQLVFADRESLYTLTPGRGEAPRVHGDLSPSEISRLRQSLAFSTEEGPFLLATWLSERGSAVFHILPEAKASQTCFFSRDFDAHCLLRPTGEASGLFRGQASALPEPMMKNPLRDLVIRHDNAAAPPEILIAVEGFGVAGLRVSPGGKETRLQTYHEGLPVQAVTALALSKGAIFAGTRGRGVYRRPPGGTRFEPWNAGLLHLPSDPNRP